MEIGVYVVRYRNVVLNFSVWKFCCYISSEIAGSFLEVYNFKLNLDVTADCGSSTVTAVATESGVVYQSHITVIMINAMLLHNCFGAESFKHRFQIPAVRV
uniref:Uncharacterized protein n=1 Tax=Solanum lycopersicum TaxID=4081 RepID=A0A3Q7H4U1_SOLLC